jgi:hypothetical protein
MSDLGYEWENLSKRYVETQERKASLCGDMVKGIQLPRSGTWVGLCNRPTRIFAQGGMVVQAEMAVTIQLQSPASMRSLGSRLPRTSWMITESKVLDGNLDDLQVNVSVDAVDVYEDNVVSDDDDSDACSEDEQGD